jgi:predicted membrane metal-binding protein
MLLGAIFKLFSLYMDQVTACYPQPESTLLSGILLGLDSDIPADLERAFQDTGTAHIIAISGLNIQIIFIKISQFVSVKVRNYHFPAHFG